MSSVEERSSATPTSPGASSSGLLRFGGRSSRSGRAGRRTGRRRLGWAVLLVLLIGAVAFVVAAESVSLVRHAKRAQASLEAFKAALSNNDPTGAQRDLRDADAQLAAADSRYRSAPLTIARHIPLLGWPVSDAGHLLSAAKDVSSAGQDALGLYDQVRGNGSKLFHNDTVSLSELAVVTRNADGMVAKMDRAQRQLRAVHAAGWEPSVGAARDKALKQVVSLRAQGRTAQRLLDLAPGLVGASGARTYLVTVLNPAELEGAGGAALNMMAIRFNQGRMKVLQSGATFDLTNENTPTMFAPLADDPWLQGAKHGLVLAAADRSPDFRTSGQELMRGYTAQFGIKVDGIVALDPLALQSLMEQIPPFVTPGYGQISSANIVQTLLVDSYANFPDPSVRHAYNDQLMNTLLHSVLGGGHMLGKGKALRQAAQGGHLQIYMNDPAVQREVASAQLLRTLPSAGQGDVVGVYTANTNASKVDYWQRRRIDQRVALKADGSADIIRTVTVTNGAPPYKGPGSDIGSGYLTRVSVPMVSLTVPASASVQSLTVNGASAKRRRVDDRGLRFIVLSPTKLSPGASMTVVLRYALPPATFKDGRYQIALAAQPLLQPVPFTVSLAGTGSCHSASGWQTSGSQARWTVPAMTQTQSEVACP